MLLKCEKGETETSTAATPKNVEKQSYTRDDLQKEWQLFIKTRAPETRNLLFEAHKRFAISIALCFLPTIEAMRDPIHDLKSLMSEAFVGLLKAIDRYDPGRGYKFTTYAWWWIRGTIKNELGLTSKLPSRKFSQVAKVLAVRKKLTTRYGDDDVSDVMLATECDLTVPEVLSALALADYLQHDKSYENNEYLVDECVRDDTNPSPEEKLGLQRLVQTMLCGLNHRQRKCILEHLVAGKTLEEIGEGMALTRERVRQIEEEVVSMLFNPELLAEARAYIVLPPTPVIVTQFLGVLMKKEMVKASQVPLLLSGGELSSTLATQRRHIISVLHRRWQLSFPEIGRILQLDTQTVEDECGA